MVKGMKVKEIVFETEKGAFRLRLIDEPKLKGPHFQFSRQHREGGEWENTHAFVTTDPAITAAIIRYNAEGGMGNTPGVEAYVEMLELLLGGRHA